MSDCIDKVEAALNYYGSAGITHWNFGRGFALRSRIADLRARGCKIVTNMEKNEDGNGHHARYVLIKQEKSNG